jgi:EAL domain-containing protein (putative c-di-GMP-specific phosphodiesterase class I)
VVPPKDFIPIAEESTLIVTLGHWIMATAFQQMHTWQAQGVEPDHLAINVSPRQFNNGNIVAEIKELLE